MVMYINIEEVSNGVLVVINGVDFVVQNGFNLEDVYGGCIVGFCLVFVGMNMCFECGGLFDNIVSILGIWVQELGEGDVIGSIGLMWVDEIYIDIL